MKGAGNGPRSQRQGIQNPGPASGSLVKRGKFVFLVRRVNAIVFEAKPNHQCVHPEIALEDADDRDRAAATGKNRLLAPFGLQRPARPRQRLRTERKLHRARRAMRDKFGAAIGGQPLLDESPESFGDLVWILRSDEPEREFGARFRRKHRFRPLANITAEDAVEAASWPRPTHFETPPALFARRNRKADFAQKIALAEG